MKLKFTYLLFITAALFGCVIGLQGCSDDNDDPSPSSGEINFTHTSTRGYFTGYTITVDSDKGPKKGEKHRSSNNFSTSFLASSSRGAPQFMLVYCPDDNVRFKLQIDKSGKDEVWNDDVYNGAILPYRNESNFYIADPSGATGSFCVMFKAFYPDDGYLFVSSPGRHLSGQSRRASLDFVLPSTSARYKVRISDPSVSFGIYEGKSHVALKVKDGDFINLSNSKHNYYLTDPEATSKTFHVRFEPANEAWMEKIPDNRGIEFLSIPGTHDTGTYALEPVNFGYSKCQNMNITQQLQFGIRYMDLRINGSMNLEHGGIPCNVSFHETVSATCDFLKKNPSETVIFELSGPSDFGKKFDDYRKNNPDLASYFWLGNYMPMLSEVRGKIMVVRRYDYDGVQGLDFNSEGIWPYDSSTRGSNPDNVHYYIEDRYFSASSAQSHDTHVKRSELYAAIDYRLNYNGWFCIAFSSVSASVSHTPYMFMWGGGFPGVNPTMSDAIVEKFNTLPAGRNCVGVIVMDYYNNNGHDDRAHITERIINSNFSTAAEAPYPLDRLHSDYD